MGPKIEPKSPTPPGEASSVPSTASRKGRARASASPNRDEVSQDSPKARKTPPSSQPAPVAPAQANHAQTLEGACRRIASSLGVPGCSVGFLGHAQREQDEVASLLATAFL